MITSANMNQFL